MTRSLTSFTIAPTVQIVQPVPNHLFSPMFGPSFRLGWKGEDPDGRGTNKPVKYKYKVFVEDGPEFEFITLLVNPDSLRRRYAPHFSDWDSVGGDTTAVDIRDLVPNRKYVAAVVAFDEVGAYSPVMNLDVNMLYFTVGFAGLLGPKLTVFNESFFFAFPSGGFSLDPATFIRTEAALRTNFRQLARNPKKMRGFSAEEREAIKKVANGGPLDYVMRYLGKLAPTGIVSGGIGSSMGYQAGGVPGAKAVPAVGLAGRATATRLTANNVNKAIDLVRRGAPLPKDTPEWLLPWLSGGIFGADTKE